MFYFRDTEEDVRAPIPQKREVLVDESFNLGKPKQKYKVLLKCDLTLILLRMLQ